MGFEAYKFKPADVVAGLNRYYDIKKTMWTNHFKVTVPSGCGAVVFSDAKVSDAINWLREECDIFYTPGMKLEDDTNDIFDNPRYRFLSELSSELGFRTIVGPGNAEKTEQDILRVVKSRNELAKDADDNRREFLRNLRCELGVLYPVVDGCIEEMEYYILERIGKLKEGNWPCENGNTFATYMRKQFPKECEKWNVTPLQEGSVYDWVQYIFGILDEWRKRALKDEEERDAVYEELGLNPAEDGVRDVLAAIRKLREDREKYKGMMNTWYGASCGDNVLPCYRDTCNNPKAVRERDKYGKLLVDIRHAAGMADGDYSDLVEYIKALREANDELANHRVAEGWLRKDNSDLAIDVANLKEQLRVMRYDILKVYREIFDCSNGDPEGTDEETLQDILTEYKRVLKLKDVAEEKTIKWKELARENEERASKYKVRLDNAERQLRWTEEVSRERLEKYEKLKSELDEMPKLRQKLAEIRDICER